MTITEITNLQQFREIHDHEKAVVYLYLETCSYCEEMSPIFQRTANLEIFDDIVFFMVSGTKVDGVKKALGAKYYPQISLFQNGKEILKIEGVADELESEVKEAFDRFVRSDGTPPLPAKPPTMFQIAPACTGQLTERSSFLFDLFHRRNKDRERGCIFRPDSNDNGLIIGDTKEGRSYFRITMWTGFPEELEKICFSVDFMPFDHSRFETAIFSASFEEIEIRDGSANVTDEPIRIRDIFPATKDGKSEKELLEDGRVNAENDVSISATADPGAQNVISTNVNGIGIYSSTARWTFSQDTTLETKRGLDASNTVFLVLPQKTEMVLMKFWAEAVLVRKGGSRVYLKIGSEENCHERILDISPA